MQKDFQKPAVGWPGDQEEGDLLLLAAKAQEGGKSLLVFQQSHDLGTLVDWCDPVGIGSDLSIWEVTILTQKSFVREITRFPKQDFDWELFKKMLSDK